MASVLEQLGGWRVDARDILQRALEGVQKAAEWTLTLSDYVGGYTYQIAVDGVVVALEGASGDDAGSVLVALVAGAGLTLSEVGAGTVTVTSASPVNICGAGVECVASDPVVIPVVYDASGGNAPSALSDAVPEIAVLAFGAMSATGQDEQRSGVDPAAWISHTRDERASIMLTMFGPRAWTIAEHIRAAVMSDRAAWSAALIGVQQISTVTPSVATLSTTQERRATVVIDVMVSHRTHKKSEAKPVLGVDITTTEQGNAI